MPATAARFRAARSTGCNALAAMRSAASSSGRPVGPGPSPPVVPAAAEVTGTTASGWLVVLTIAPAAKAVPTAPTTADVRSARPRDLDMRCLLYTSDAAD